MASPDTRPDTNPTSVRTDTRRGVRNLAIEVGGGAVGGVGLGLLIAAYTGVTFFLPFLGVLGAVATPIVVASARR